MEDKRIQFAYVFSLLSKIKPITSYEDFQPLFEFLKNKSNPKKHWFDGVGWEIVEHIEWNSKDKFVIHNSNFIFLTCDEMTTMDNISWANVHDYIV